MPLERFIPKSPDPFIRNSQDFEVAKFGHLNTIIEYVNTYVAADSLQLAGTGPLTSTARYITDSLGNTSTLAISTVNIGIGTTTPIVPLNIYNSSASVSSIVLVEQDTAAVVGQINQYRKNGSVNLTNGTEMGRLSFGGYFNSTYSPFSQVCSAIYGYYGGTGTDRVGGLRLITWNGGGASTRLQVAPDGKIAIGTTTATAKLQIVGEGSTSATTSLLVQNSNASSSLEIKDDQTVTMPGTVNVGSLSAAATNGTYRSILTPYDVNTVLLSTNVRFGGTYLTSADVTLFGGTSQVVINGATGNNAGSALVITGTTNANTDAQNKSVQTITSNFTHNNSSVLQSFRFLNLEPTINQSGISVAHVRGIYYNPTITSIIGPHTAIETTSGNVLLATTSGNVGIGTTAPAAKLTIDSGNLLFTTNGNSEIYGLRNGVNQDTRIIINNQSTGGLHLGAKFGNPTGSIYFECGSGAYTERMRLTPNGNLLIGNTNDTARLSITGTGSTSATTSLLVWNSGATNLLQMRDDGALLIGTTASGLGVIYVPHDNVYGDRVFLAMQNGGANLLSTRSNDALLINNGHFWAGLLKCTGTNQGIFGQYAVQSNNSNIILSGQVNAYAGTSQNDACNLVYIQNRGTTLQAAGSINWIKMDGNVDEAGGGGNKWCTGIYYNPTFSGGTLLANSHYCYHATSGQMMVNTTSPNSSAQLQVDSTTRGFLPPRMTTAQRTAIVSPAAGLIVYDTDTNKSYTYDGTAWQAHW